MLNKLHSYIECFNRNDNELYSQLFPNDKAFDFLKDQIPLIDCPDRDIEKNLLFPLVDL